MKRINKFELNTDNISQHGEIRKFAIYASKNAVFSLEILNEDSYYYNFETKEFTSTVYRIENEVITSGKYEGEIAFPEVSDKDHYDVRLWAHDIYDTKHAEYIEVRREDNTIDINASSGSNSNLLKKKIFQLLSVNVTITPNTGMAGTNWGTINSSIQTISITPLSTRNKKYSFSTTVTASNNAGITILRQPNENDFYATSTRQYGTAVEIPDEDLYEYSRAMTTTVNGATSSSNRLVFDNTITELGLIVGDAVVVGTYTDKTLLITHLNPDGDNTSEIQVSASISVSDDAAVTFYYKGYYRWNIHSSSSLVGLSSGMKIRGNSITTGVWPYLILSNYTRKTQIKRKVDRVGRLLEKGVKEKLPKKSIKDYIKEEKYPAIETISEGLVINAETNVITTQRGIITHNQQQYEAAANQNFKVFAHGPSLINKLIQTDFIVTNLKAELTELTTLVDGAVSNSTTVAVDDRSGFINNITRVKAIGIDTTAEEGGLYPLVTAGGGNDGAGNITISSNQTIEDNQTLTLLGTGSVVTITCDIEFKRFPSAARDLYIDVSKFLLTR